MYMAYEISLTNTVPLLSGHFQQIGLQHMMVGLQGVGMVHLS